MKRVLAVIIISIVLGGAGVWYLILGGLFDKQFEVLKQSQIQVELQLELMQKLDSLIQFERVYFAQKQQELIAAKDSIIIAAAFRRYNNNNMYDIFVDSSIMGNQVGLGGE